MKSRDSAIGPLPVRREIGRLIRRIRKRDRPFAGVYSAFWTVPEGTGFSSEKYSRDARTKALASRTEKLDLGLSHQRHPSKIALPLVASLIARERRPLRVLDFGGGAGVDASILAAMPKLDFRYHVVDLDPMVAAGREVWADQESITFSSELPPSGAQYDLVYAWSAIQYHENPLVLLERFADYNPAAILLVFHPIGASTFIRGQVNLGVSVPHWVLGIDDIKDHLSALGYSFAAGAWSGRQYNLESFDEEHRHVGMADLLFLKTAA
jgi:putative methyltransferase (TIGR04325 family)